MDRYKAVSASDKTDDWPFWYVADTFHGYLNVTADVIRQHVSSDHKGGVFTDRINAIALANRANT
jgi:hypothetical protein